MQANKNRLLLGSTVIIALYAILQVTIAYVFAQVGTASSPITVTLEMQNIIAGAASGAFYGTLGYYKDSLTVIDPKTNLPEKFNPRQWGITVAVGIIVGLFIPITAPTDLQGFALTIGTAYTQFGSIWFIQSGVTIIHAFTGKTIVVQKPTTP